MERFVLSGWLIGAFAFLIVFQYVGKQIIIKIIISGLGNYQQQDLQYGPARGASFPSDNSYSSYGSSDPSAGYPGAAPGYAGETASFGRGSSSARGFHPYGR